MHREVRVRGEWRWSAAGASACAAEEDREPVRVVFCDEAGPVTAQREPRVEPAPEPCERQRKRKLQPDEEAAEALLLKMVKREQEDTPQPAEAETIPVQSPPIRTAEADSTVSLSTREDSTTFMNQQQICRTGMLESMYWPDGMVNIDLERYLQIDAMLKSENAEHIDGTNTKPPKLFKTSKNISKSTSLKQKDTAKSKPGQTKSGKVQKTSEAKTKSKKPQSNGTEKQPISRVDSPSADSQQMDTAKTEPGKAQHIGGLRIKPRSELQISKTETQSETPQIVNNADTASGQHISTADIKPGKVQKINKTKSKSRKPQDNGNAETKTPKPRKNAAKSRSKKPQDLTAYACEICGLVLIGGDRVVAHILTTHWD